MRILIWGINYAPEVTGIAVYNQMLAEWLAARGHDVEIITTFAYYPAWEKAKEDRSQWARTEVINGVIVRRCWHYVPRKVTAAKRILHEASFIATSFLRALSTKKADIAVVVSPPLGLGLAAWFFRLIRRTPYVFHVQDLQPDAAVGLGMLKPGAMIRLLYRLERLAYAKAKAVSGISTGMLDAYRRKGVPEDKIVYFPNPVELPIESAIPPRGAFRRIHDIGEDEFVALYSGNLGVKQGLHVLIDTAERLKLNPHVLILICGDGAQKASLIAEAEKRKLPNIRFLPLQPKEQFQQMLVDADICLVTQQKGSGAAFFPSKLLSILSLGRPALTVADTDSAVYQALHEGGFGQNVGPDDPAKLADTLLRMATGEVDLDTHGKNGRAYVARFARDTVMQQFEQVLLNLVESMRRL